MGNADLFSVHRTRLFKIAYRMLRSRADAEDVVQDVYLRWHQAATTDIQSPIAFLVTAATRLCIDRLRSLKQRPAQWIDGWHPDPRDEDCFDSPEAQMELRDKLSTAFLVVLECLRSDERTVFLLHDVFDFDYGEISDIVAKSEASCRQIVHRARQKLCDRSARHAITSETRDRVLKMFHSVLQTGNRLSVLALVAERIDYESLAEDAPYVKARACQSLSQLPSRLPPIAHRKAA